MKIDAETAYEIWRQDWHKTDLKSAFLAGFNAATSENNEEEINETEEEKTCPRCGEKTDLDGYLCSSCNDELFGN